MALTFEIGNLVATKRVWELIDTDPTFNRFIGACLTRYMMCDWGDICDEDWVLNEEFMKNGGRVMGTYPLPPDMVDEWDDHLWIITEEDKSATTLLFPSEY